MALAFDRVAARLRSALAGALWVGTLGCAFVVVPPAAAQNVAEPTGVIVNGVALSADTLRALQRLYPVHIAPARYWYDPVSGAWGREGEPIAGQMRAGLKLGGRLRADASRGSSGIYINGRQLTFAEKAFLERACQRPALPGRYWVLSSGVGGYEGKPALFNLSQCTGGASRGGGSTSSSRTYCDDAGNCTTSGILGTITTGRW